MSQTKSFEKNLAALTEIVDKMEQADLGLEESLKLYEQGVKLTRQCQKIIDGAEQKIKQLMDDPS